MKSRVWEVLCAIYVEHKIWSYDHIPTGALCYRVMQIEFASTDNIDNPVLMQQGIHSSLRSKIAVGSLSASNRFLKESMSHADCMTTLIHLASVFPARFRKMTILLPGDFSIRALLHLLMTMILDNSGAVTGSQLLPEHCIMPTLRIIACWSFIGPMHMLPVGPEIWMLAEIFRRLS